MRDGRLAGEVGADGGQRRRQAVAARALALGHLRSAAPSAIDGRSGGPHQVAGLGNDHDSHHEIHGMLDSLAAGAQRDGRAADELRVETGQISRAVGSDDVPAEFKSLVEEYYRSLARQKGQPR